MLKLWCLFPYSSFELADKCIQCIAKTINWLCWSNTFVEDCIKSHYPNIFIDRKSPQSSERFIKLSEVARKKKKVLLDNRERKTDHMYSLSSLWNPDFIFPNPQILNSTLYSPTPCSEKLGDHSHQDRNVSNILKCNLLARNLTAKEY